jgi:putative ABC transport system substrate-binding protein
MPVIGFLNSRAPGDNPAILAAFLRGLKEAGYVEGQNVTVEYRWADGQYDRLPGLAADLVGRQVAVIISNGPSARIAKAATSTVPIVFAVGFDPVTFGLVTNLSRPDGNLTGVSILDVEIGPKRLELLHELIPNEAVMALLVNPTTPAAETIVRAVQAAARDHGLKLHVVHATTDREFAAAGGLISYGTSLGDAYRQVGLYTGRILKGERVSDLPVQQATKVEMVLNLKTAKALGLNIPNTLIGRADEVIE